MELADGGENLIDGADCGEHVSGSGLFEKGDEGIEEGDAFFVAAIEDDDGLVLHDGVAILLEEQEGEDFLDGAGAAGESDEGLASFDHYFHAGVDIGARPETVETIRKTFEGDDVGDVGASGPASIFGASFYHCAHDASAASTGDAADTGFGEAFSEVVTIVEIGLVFDASGAKNADAELGGIAVRIAEFGGIGGGGFS